VKRKQTGGEDATHPGQLAGLPERSHRQILSCSAKWPAYLHVKVMATYTGLVFRGHGVVTCA